MSRRRACWPLVPRAGGARRRRRPAHEGVADLVPRARPVAVDVVGDLSASSTARTTAALFGLFRDSALLFGIVLARRDRPDRRLPRPGRRDPCTSRSRWGCCSAARSATSSTGSGSATSSTSSTSGIGDVPLVHVQRRRRRDQPLADPAVLLAHPAVARGHDAARPGPATRSSCRRRSRPSRRPGPMPDAAALLAGGSRDLRVPAGAAAQRVDRFVADVTGLSRSHVQKLISAGNLTSGGVALKANAVVVAGTPLQLVVPEPAPLDLAPAPEIAARRRLRGRRPADRRQAGRPRRPSVARPQRRDARQRAARPRRRRAFGGIAGVRGRASSIASTATRAAC